MVFSLKGLVLGPEFEVEFEEGLVGLGGLELE